MNGKKAETQHIWAWAYKKWCDGYTLNQIAEALGVSEKTVQRNMPKLPRIRPLLIYDPEEPV